MPNWEFAVGDSVTLAPGATFTQNPNLKRDQVGTISQLGDESDDEEPFEVVNEAGKTWWYELGQLVRASPGSTAKKKKKKKKKEKEGAGRKRATEDEETVDIADAEEAKPEELQAGNLLGGISDDDESDDGAEPAEEKGDDDFEVSEEEADDPNDEAFGEKPKAKPRKRRRKGEGEEPAAEGGGGGESRAGRAERRGNARWAAMDDQPTADPRVDPYCEINERQVEGKVVEFGDEGEKELYSVTMRKQPTLSQPRGFTAVLQIIQFTRGGVPKFCAFARWGPAGAEGQTKVSEHPYLEGAERKFKEHYRTLTGNDWATRDNGLLKVEGKYEVVDVDVLANVADLSMTSDDSYDAAHPIDEDVELKLAPEVAAVVREMCDFGRMYRQLEERGVELGRLPVCRFTRKHVRQAFTALKSLQFILSDLPSLDALSEEETAEIVTATYQFWAACPHADEPAKITDSEQVAYLTQTVSILAEVEKAAQTIRFERTSQPDVHPLDRDYAMFRSKITAAEEDSSERTLIESMVAETVMPKLDGFELKVKQVLMVERQGEAAQYAPFTKLHNKQLLWHGAAPSLAQRSILREGLHVSDPLSPSLGESNGLKFHDLASPAAQACGEPAPGATAVLLLAEVALGDIDVKRVPIDDTVASPAKYCHSLQSLGAVVPDATKTMDVGGVKWHLGPLAEEQAKLDDAEGLGGQQHYNQFVVHDESQYCIRFMVQVEFGGMKARTVPSATTATDSAAAKPEAGSSGPRVTFADDLPLDMDDVDLEVEEPEAPGAAAASQPPETEPSQPLEMYSMTQDGPEYRSAQRFCSRVCSGVRPCLTPARAVAIQPRARRLRKRGQRATATGRVAGGCSSGFI